ncbi:hypothetical protein EP331_15335 [bacterium]|nr:MAG: hypothetical protein EP331_15335 [bacterium]
MLKLSLFILFIFFTGNLSAQQHQLSGYYFLGDAQDGYMFLIQKNEKTAKEHFIVYDYLKKTFTDIHRFQSVKTETDHNSPDNHTIVTRDISHYKNQHYVLNEWYAYWFDSFTLRKKVRIRYDDYVFPTHITRLNDDEVLIGGFDTLDTNHFWRVHKNGTSYQYDNIPPLGPIITLVNLNNKTIAVCKKGILEFGTNTITSPYLLKNLKHDIHSAIVNANTLSIFVMQNEIMHVPDLMIQINPDNWNEEFSRNTATDFINRPLGIDKNKRVWFAKNGNIYFELNGKVVKTRFENSDEDSSNSFFNDGYLNINLTPHGILANRNKTLTLIPFYDLE